ncbi:hypothetical protein DYQ86_23255 [Acidobacteria bacterium AB60]|nr:hypothetical protein DYQ86_23255 [Acidobacteria bacterium AB60]
MSANQQAFPNNLKGDVGFSGTGYSCIGVPRLDCETATKPLTTDHGDFYLFQPYLGMDAAGYPTSMNGALFIQTTRDLGLPLPASALLLSSNHASGLITYHMLLVSDVSLDGKLYQNATIHLSFESKVSAVRPLAGAGPSGAINSNGAARVEILRGDRTISAEFDPGQIYIYFDPETASAGFGSFSGGRAYPAMVSPTNAHGDSHLTAAVSAILTTGSSDFSPATSTLAHATDLKHETMLSDFVSSCTDYDFTNLVGTCYNLPASSRLTTNRGDFFLYQPYNMNGNVDPSNAVRSSDNWGIFWTTFDAVGAED